MRPVSVILGFSCVLALAGWTWAADRQGDFNDDLKRRFLDEAPKEWDRYLEWSKKLQGSCDVVLRQLKTNQVLDRMHYECKQNARCAALVEQFLGPDYFDGRINVQNPRYGFQLRRANDNRPWAVAGLDLGVDDGYGLEATDPGTQVVALVGKKPLKVGFGVYASLTDLIKAPGINILSAREHQYEGRPCVRIEMTGEPQWGPPRRQNGQLTKVGTWLPLRKAAIVLDPSIGWLCREYTADLQGPSGSRETWHALIAYNDSQESFPFVKEIRTRLFLAGDTKGEPSREEIHTYTLYADERVPDSAFALSAYGFPEPDRTTAWVTSYIALAFAGILAIVAALVIYKWRWSHRAAS